MLFCAFAGLVFKREFDVTLRAGETFSATDPYGHHWQFVSQGVSRFDALNRQVTAVSLKPTRDGKAMPIIESEKRQHVDSRGDPTFEPSTAVGIYSQPSEDVYVVLTGVLPQRHRRNPHHVQPARVVGLVRRDDHGVGWADRHVAASRPRAIAERLRRSVSAPSAAARAVVAP